MERWAKRLFVGFWKDGLSTELQAKMSRGCKFLLFWHHNYQVTLRWLSQCLIKDHSSLLHRKMFNTCLDFSALTLELTLS